VREHGCLKHNPCSDAGENLMVKDQYDHIAEQYKDAERTIEGMHVVRPTFLKLCGVHAPLGFIAMRCDHRSECYGLSRTLEPLDTPPVSEAGKAEPQLSPACSGEIDLVSYQK
jgi:hypothetical protein